MQDNNMPLESVWTTYIFVCFVIFVLFVFSAKHLPLCSTDDKDLVIK